MFGWKTESISSTSLLDREEELEIACVPVGLAKKKKVYDMGKVKRILSLVIRTSYLSSEYFA